MKHKRSPLGKPDSKAKLKSCLMLVMNDGLAITYPKSKTEDGKIAEEGEEGLHFVTFLHYHYEDLGTQCALNEDGTLSIIILSIYLYTCTWCVQCLPLFINKLTLQQQSDGRGIFYDGPKIRGGAHFRLPFRGIQTEVFGRLETALGSSGTHSSQATEKGRGEEGVAERYLVHIQQHIRQALISPFFSTGLIIGPIINSPSQSNSIIPYVCATLTNLHALCIPFTLS